MELSQIFCIHFWKDIKREYLRWRREEYLPYTYGNFSYYAVTQECIKCKRVKIIEQRKNYRNEIPPEENTNA